MQQTEFFLSSCAIFCTFTPLTAQQMKISNMKKKNKKTWRYHHFTQVHQNHDYPLHCSRDMARDRCNCYFHFELYFSLLPPPPPSPNSPKNENFTTKKKLPGDIIILHMCTKNHDHMLYCPFTPPLPQPPPPVTAQKMKKNTWRYHHLTQVYQKS